MHTAHAPFVCHCKTVRGWDSRRSLFFICIPWQSGADRQCMTIAIHRVPLCEVSLYAHTQHTPIAYTDKTDYWHEQFEIVLTNKSMAERHQQYPLKCV